MAQRTQLTQIIELGVSQRQMNDHLLHDAVTALAQEAARSRVAASAPSALTDSSGGTAGASLVAVVTPTIGVVDGATTFSPKAGFDTATAAIEAGHKELATTLNLFLARILGSAGPRVTMAQGGSANGTIEAITAALSAAASGCVSAATARVEINKARNVQAALASALNYCRVAMGLNPVADGSGGQFNRLGTGWNVNGLARALTAAAATSGQDTLTDASADAALIALRSNIATMAAFLNEMRGTIQMGPFVVATSNPRTRLVPADITVAV